MNLNLNLVFLIMASPQKLVLAPRATVRDNTFYGLKVYSCTERLRFELNCDTDSFEVFFRVM